MAGEVVGITTSGYGGGGNLNFAIPINDVKLVLRSPFSKAHALPDEPEPNKKAEEVDADARAKQAAQAAHAAQEIALKAQHEAEIAKVRKKEVNIVKALNDKLDAAKTASNAGDFETAINVLNEANAIDATRDLIWFKLADAYRMSAPKQAYPAEKQKRYEMAAADYQKAIDLRSASEQAKKDPDNNAKMAAYYNNLGEAYSKSNKIDDAVNDYNKAAQLDTAHASVYYFNEAAILTSAGKLDDAIAAFDKVIAADPTKVAAYYWRGWSYQSKKVFDMALADYNKVLELNPKYTNAVTGRARLFDSKHEFSKAIAEYEKAIELDPRCLEAYNNLAWLLATTPADGVRNGAKAVEYGQNALALADKGKSFIYMDTLAAAYAEAGRFADAVALQSKAISLLPKDYDPKEIVAYMTRLQFYKENKPYRGNP
jgi:tetratricopeptide (TPR) repeat protein